MAQKQRRMRLSTVYPNSNLTSEVVTGSRMLRGFVDRSESLGWKLKGLHHARNSATLMLSRGDATRIVVARFVRWYQ